MFFVTAVSLIVPPFTTYTYQMKKTQQDLVHRLTKIRSTSKQKLLMQQ